MTTSSENTTASVPQKRRKRSKKLPALVVKSDIYQGMKTKEALAYWVALPTKIREPKTQKELADLLDVSEERLCQIKREPGFLEEVMEYRKTFFKQFTSDVIQSMVETAKGGNERAAKIFLQFIEDFQESTKQTIEKTETRKFVFELGEAKFSELRKQLSKARELKRLESGDFIEAEEVNDAEISNTPES